MTEDRYGVFEVYSPPNPTIDIVAIHGLNGHPFKTWTSQGSKTFWLSDPDFLPLYLKNARILTYGYNANAVSVLGSTSSDCILQHAQSLVANLESNRAFRGATKRPIIFLCHSLGGIIVKQALVYSKGRTSKTTEHLQSIYLSTYGILFLGTPHSGSSKAKLAMTCYKVLKSLAPSKICDADHQLLQALQENSQILQTITDGFLPLMKQFCIFYFWEQNKTDLVTSWDYVVDKKSAAPIVPDTERCGIPADHRGMTRFDNPQSTAFKTLASALMRYERQGQPVVARRWLHARESMLRQRQSVALELIMVE